VPRLITDLGVAARLGLRETGRTARGEREPGAFERDVEGALAAGPARSVA
jgi:hypothetical protein